MTTTPEWLETAVRAWTTTPDCGPAHTEPVPIERARYALVLDTETTIDAAQRLTFGSYRYFRMSWNDNAPELMCAEEGLFYADDLGERDPDGLAVLTEYARSQKADVGGGLRRELRLMPATGFLKVLYDEAIRKRSLIVGFNLPFDLSRFADSWTDARSDHFRRGFSLTLWTWLDKQGRRRENKYRPRLAIKNIDSKRSLKGFTSTRETDWIDRIAVEGEAPRDAYSHRGHLLDLRTLVFALTDKSHSLASACKAFRVTHGKQETEEHGRISESYIDYNRSDVRATSELLVAALTEYYRHPIDLQPTKAYSPASVGKAYLRAFGVPPILHRQPDFPLDFLGAAMEAYYGGRAECRIRHEMVPVVHVDFVSMYPTVNALMDLWSLHIAERLEVVDTTETTREFVERIDLADCFDPDIWPALRTLVLVEPFDDILPVRAKYEEGRDNWQIGVNRLWGEPRWYTLADVIASKLPTDEAPIIRRAVSIVPVGQLAGLESLRLRGEVLIDPYRDDPFKIAIEQRASIPKEDALNRFLKIFANGTVYGMLAEMNPQAGTEEWVQVFTGSGSFGSRVRAPERPGEYTFPPLPAFIAGAARLMLAMLEAAVAELGGTYAMCDTDSMSIVATDRRQRLESGIRAISWTDVEDIKRRFDALNPYDPSAISSILKTEDVNYLPTGEREQLWCYAVSAKRYVHGQRFE